MRHKYDIKYLEAAKNDLLSLPDDVFDEFLIMEAKLKNNIHLGQPLEDKNGRDLSDCYKIYFCNAKYRIVYKKIESGYEFVGINEVKKEVAEVIAVGKRNKEQVYKDAAERLNR